MREQLLDLTPQEIEQLSRIMAKTITQTPRTVLTLFGAVDVEVTEHTHAHLRYGLILTEEEFKQYVRLDLISSAVHGLSDPLGQLRDFITGVLDGVKNWIVSQIKGALDWVYKGLVNFISDILAETLRKIKDIAPQIVSDVGKAIAGAIREITSAVKGFFDVLNSGIRDLGNSISYSIQTVSSTLSNAITTVGSSIASAINTVSSSIMSAISNVGSTLSGAITSVATSVTYAVTSVGSSIMSMITGIGSALSSAITAVGSSLSSAIASVGSSIAGAIGSIGASLASAISQVGTSIAGMITNIGTALSSSIAMVGYSLSSSIASIGASLSTAIAQVGTSIGTAIATVSSSIAIGLATISASIAQSIVTISGAIATGLNMVITTLSSLILQLGSSISIAISTIGAGIAQSINLVLGTLATRIIDLGASISAAIGTIGASIAASIALLRGDIQTAISIWRDYVPVMTESLQKEMRTLRQEVLQGMTETSQTINNTLTRFSDTVIGIMLKSTSAILDVSQRLQGFINTTMTNFTNEVAKNLKTMTDSILDTYKKTIDTFTEALDKVSGKILDTYNRLQDALNKNFKEVIGNILDASRKTMDTILDNAKRTQDFILQSYKDLMDALTSNLEKFANTLEQVGRALMGFTNAILQLPDLVDTRMGSYSQKFAKTFWDVATSKSSPSYAVLWHTSFWESVAEGLSKDAKEGMKLFWERLTDLYKEGSSSWWDSFVLLFTDPWKLLNDVFLKPLQDAWEPVKSGFMWVAQKIFEGLQWLGEQLWNGIQALLEWVKNTILDVSFTICEGFLSFGQAIYNLFAPKGTYPLSHFEGWLKEIFEFVNKNSLLILQSFMESPMNTFFKALEMVKPTGMEYKEFSDEFFKSLTFSLGVLLFPLFGQIPIRAIIWAGRQVGSYFFHLADQFEVSAEPIGLGVKGSFSIFKTIGASIQTFMTMLQDSIEVLQNSLVYGIGIWVSQPITRMLNAFFRNIVTMQLPAENVLIEILRRHVEYQEAAPGAKPAPTDKYKSLWARIRYYLATFGYSDDIINNMINWIEDDYIEIEDRFGIKRTIPRSLVHQIPSASDFARMMVRDIILKPEEFAKALQLQGMTKDVAILYYLLHFRYPSPELLWSFLTRGISYMAWAKRTPDDIEDAKKLGLPEPQDATSMHGKPKELFEMFKTYMKWHDYARFAYRQGWPSDNIIIQDVLADIPTKIDMRWMVRWGLYELMSAKGVKVTTGIDQMCCSIIEDRQVSNIALSLDNFCRTLQATGLHPYWVPIVAVAEAINAIADERTLLRTGFINLFKEGYWNVGQVDELMSGFFKASFSVAYFDINDMTWKTGYINVPVMFLPPERKLLQLRALMDRALDILRDIQRDIFTAYQEFILDTYSDVKNRLSQVIAEINNTFASDYKKITGQTLPDNLKLTYVEEYYKTYINALNTWRDVFTIRRIRLWTQRWLGWLMYRLASGAVTAEDLINIILKIKDYAKLTAGEINYFKEVMNILYGIAMREYSPTPSQLATFAEYIEITDSDIKEVFQARQIPERWANIWIKYIKVRPLADDIRSLINAYFRALRYTETVKTYERAVIAAASKLNFTQEELQLFRLRAEIEETTRIISENRYSAFGGYIPTPSMLASMAEYVPEVRKFFPQVMQARNVSPEWQAIWAKYVDIRPLVDDVKKMLSRAESLYASFMMKKEDFQKILDNYKDFIGITDKEEELLMKTTDLERWRNAWSELIGSVSKMMTLAEYSPKARAYALGKVTQMIEALPLTPEEKQELKAIYEQYIRVRPVISEVTQYIRDLVNLYVDGLIDDTTLSSELDALKKWGLDDYEIMFWKSIASLRRARKLRIPLAYTPEE